MSAPTGTAEQEPRRLSEDAVELAISLTSSHGTRSMPASPVLRPQGLTARLGLAGMARRTLGISLLLVTVFLWTLSNFLASFIFSGHIYDKPFFLVYVNSSVFAISLLPMFVNYLVRRGVRGAYRDAIRAWHEYRGGYTASKNEEEGSDDERLLVDDEDAVESIRGDDEKMGFGATAALSLEFSMLWFAANYLASACLEYTSVASVTILTSTSSIWTLIFCALFRVETFSLRKLLGVLASLIGVVLISSVDLSGESDDNRGSFPHKSAAQIAIGDSMAFVSAIVYGLYVTVMKRKVGDESKVNMRLFFGLVGVFNLALLWPLFFILHWTGIEPFEMPPTGMVWTVIIINSLASFVSDMCWAFAMLLTTPLVVTVGISLTIPLSLIGEMIQYNQYAGVIYWVGAAIVLVSFVFVNQESSDAEEPEAKATESEHRRRRSTISAAGTEL